MKNNHLDSKDLAKMTGLTEARLRQIAATGAIPGPTAGRWQHPETVQRLFAHYRRRNELKPLDEARLRKMQAEASMAELAYQKETGALLSVTQTFELIDQVVAALRSGILASSLPKEDRNDLLLELQRLLRQVRPPSQISPPPEVENATG